MSEPPGLKSYRLDSIRLPESFLEVFFLCDSDLYPIVLTVWMRLADKVESARFHRVDVAQSTTRTALS